MTWLPPRPVRRAVIDPLWIPVAAFLALVLLLIVIVTVLLAPLSKPRRLLRAALLACVYLYMDVGLVLACFGLWLRHPRKNRDDRAWRAAHAVLLGRALSRLKAASERLFGYQIDMVGGELDVRAEAALLVLARHAGPGDSFSLVYLLVTRYGRTPRVVLKRALQWDPGLDVVLSRLRCYFLPSKSGAGEDRVGAVADMVAEMGPGDALLLFPEGANWTPRRHRRAVLRLLRSGKREHARRVSARTHVLPPKPGGTAAALGIRADTDVLIVAHAGLDTLVNPRQMWQALPLTRRPMRIRAWLHNSADVPRTEQTITPWLDEQWAAIDQWVGTQQHRD